MTHCSELDLNYPTKATLLWVENDEGYYRHWTKRAHEMIATAARIWTVTAGELLRSGELSRETIGGAPTQSGLIGQLGQEMESEIFECVPAYIEGADPDFCRDFRLYDDLVDYVISEVDTEYIAERFFEASDSAPIFNALPKHEAYITTSDPTSKWTPVKLLDLLKDLPSEEEDED